MKVVVDRGRCTGLGICASVVPDVFEVGADGDLVTLLSAVPDERGGELQQAVVCCPNEALRLEP
ncbi:ferredoxin [Cryptosporangium aurantiacum]|uniref:Ferredoxin n=1 Tax=Cryptosporangium aurantiacum TaxID=134849 RepID=A0A1M7PK75_9ACTN|nr:ferredoxin [Cryptosporangium aurantiacum]SHN17546.1 ferredoxin [Cryptosporangium aurantiacum]